MPVLIFGLDGATLDLIQPWVQDNKLPTLRRLMSTGCWGPLESTTPPMTSPAWPSFATANYPAKHGVFDFVSAHSGTYNIVNATGIKRPTLWEQVSNAGHRVGIMNVPVTYPPRPVNGFLISGLLSPSGADVTYPADLLDQYEHGSDHYRVMPKVQYKPGNEQQFLHDLEELVDIRGHYASRLLRDQPWDLAMIHFLATDLVQHALWRFMDPTHPRHEPDSPFQDAILRIYQRVDRTMGKLLEQVGDEVTVMVMSDHGFGPLHGVVNLNILLWEHGLLHMKPSPFTRLRTIMFRYGITPKAVYNLLTRLNLQNIVARVAKSTRNAVYNKFLSFDDIDWSRTVAYSLGHMGQIYINVKGRESKGIIERGAPYEQAIDKVIDALRTLTTPDGRPILDRVIRSSDLPGGPYADDGPDLHLVMDGYRYISCPLFATDGNVISKQIRGDSGSHRKNGTFIAAGPDIRAGEHVDGARIVDLTPTVLHLMDCPIPRDVDGRVLTQILTIESTHNHAPARTAEDESTPIAIAFSDQEEREIEERLQGLGYLS